MRIKLFFAFTVILCFITSLQAAPGDLDTSFGNGGKVTAALGGLSSDRALDVVAQSDGKLVAVGYRSSISSAPGGSVIIRYNENGSLDTSFNGSGIIVFQIN